MARLADGLGLAAAPCFALMALLSAFSGAADPVCFAAVGGWRVGDMTTMYLAMSAFHLPAWLRVRWRTIQRE